MQFAISYTPPFRILATITGIGQVDVDADRIDVRMGWAFRASIPRASVRNAEQIDRVEPIFGGGVHGWNGRWAVNGSQRGAVKLTMEPAAKSRVLFVAVTLRELFLSLDEPEAFVVASGRSATSSFG